MNSTSHTDTDSERRLTQKSLRDEILHVTAPTCLAFLVEHRGQDAITVGWDEDLRTRAQEMADAIGYDMLDPVSRGGRTTLSGQLSIRASCSGIGQDSEFPWIEGYIVVSGPALGEHGTLQLDFMTCVTPSLMCTATANSMPCPDLARPGEVHDPCVSHNAPQSSSQTQVKKIGAPFLTFEASDKSVVLDADPGTWTKQVRRTCWACVEEATYRLPDLDTRLSTGKIRLGDKELRPTLLQCWRPPKSFAVDNAVKDFTASLKAAQKARPLANSSVCLQAKHTAAWTRRDDDGELFYGTCLTLSATMNGEVLHRREGQRPLERAVHIKISETHLQEVVATMLSLSPRTAAERRRTAIDRQVESLEDRSVGDGDTADCIVAQGVCNSGSSSLG